MKVPLLFVATTNIEKENEEMRRKEREDFISSSFFHLQGDGAVVAVVVDAVDDDDDDVDAFVVHIFSSVEMRVSADERALLIKESSASVLSIRTRAE